MYDKVYEIIKEEAARYGITASKLTSPGRRKTTVAARRAAVIRVRAETELSLSEIADAFGFKDHSSVVHYLETEK